MIVVRQAYLGDAGDVAETVSMIDMYAQDPMGGGAALTETVKAKLAEMLTSHPGAVVFLASLDDRTVGIANCFYGMSSFTGSPVLNLRPEVDSKTLNASSLLNKIWLSRVEDPGMRREFLAADFL